MVADLRASPLCSNSTPRPRRTAQPHPQEFDLAISLGHVCWLGARATWLSIMSTVFARACITVIDGALVVGHDAWRTEAPLSSALRGPCMSKRLGQDHFYDQTLAALPQKQLSHNPSCAKGWQVGLRHVSRTGSCPSGLGLVWLANKQPKSQSK